MAEPLLSLTDLRAGYGPTQILQGISLDVAQGERLALIGRNGVGKTTLLATIMGLTTLHGGALNWNGAPIGKLAPHRRAALGLGLVPQTRDIFKSLTVEENLIAGLRGDASIEEAYDLFPRLKERRRNGGGQLSGGEQQMLSVARTLMGRPKLLMLDEPLEGLAPVICEMLMDVFERLAGDGRTTVILVEQHAGMALGFADRGVILEAGRIVHTGDAKTLRADAATLGRYLGVGLAD
ncbi:MAG: ATP-binding cassette domain-containing protein [Rhodobacteraceae bacterium]|nr:ATP-binding cassette domain-containing protein [Paracoccaceae bacterium]